MKNLLKKVNLLTTIFVLFFCLQSIAQSKQGTECDIEPKAFAEAEKGDAILLDVRTQDEFDSGHLVGAVLIDFFQKDFKDEIGKLERDKKYFVYCKVGGRSSKAMKYMVSMGFKDVCNVEGGIQEISKAGMPIVK